MSWLKVDKVALEYVELNHVGQAPSKGVQDLRIRRASGDGSWSLIKGCVGRRATAGCHEFSVGRRVHDPNTASGVGQ